jgi:hypothetical protein
MNNAVIPLFCLHSSRFLSFLPSVELSLSTILFDDEFLVLTIDLAVAECVSTRARGRVSFPVIDIDVG